mmetsp:Transcript_78712/g.205281  ORF Transcript_78712/g.205281 Transcript_78712/m.205281 type:complete len:623 (-) Transcript_78712:159-2027(-)
MGATASTDPPQKQLEELLKVAPWLESKDHHLNRLVEEVRAAIKNGHQASEKMNTLKREAKKEEEEIKQFFKMFDNSGAKGQLTRADIGAMNKYLGFPAGESDITDMMAKIDKDGGGTIQEVEFKRFVGGMGGIPNLLKTRQAMLGEKSGRRQTAMESGETLSSLERSRLDQCGIDSEAQMYWSMVVPQSELRAAARLEKCQEQAICKIRELAKQNHKAALPKLQKRVKDLHLPEDNLWLTLAWIRELAPIIVHINMDKMLQFMETDTHYRNQFETKTSGGLLKPEVRKKWEKDLFDGAYDRSGQLKDRPKYGVQNVMNDHRGVVACKQYGESYLILKDVRLRCTFAPEDSANLKAEKLAVPDFYAHVLAEYSTEELKETLKVATSAEEALLGDSEKVGKMKYKEAQIHGEVSFSQHVERLVVHTKHRTPTMEQRIKKMCQKHGFEMTWMDKEQERMKKEAMHKLGGAEWKDRLAKLDETGDSSVPEGYCKVGCGRCVAPGLTRSGKPYQTCCRGCIMGFGHDDNCGKIDPTKVGAGLCKMGCGRPIAIGVDDKGRALQTCCRGCAMGGDHDATCGKAPAKPGMCRMGCGKKVAPGKTSGGKAFDTCCRGCAKGEAHSPDCKG